MSCPLTATIAISGNGHGRFGSALTHGVDVLLGVELLSHRCDNTLCQTVSHLSPRVNADSRRGCSQRRHSPMNPLRDQRGARRGAQEIRDAARGASDVLKVGKDGLGRDLQQDPLFAASNRAGVVRGGLAT